MASYRFECSECGTGYDPDPERMVCERCAAKQTEGGRVRGVLHVMLDPLPPKIELGPEHGLDTLGLFSPSEIAPGLERAMAVGRTPLLPAAGLGRRLGVERLWLKDDTRNPSGSTKDRASLLVAAKALEFGFQTLAVASTGNAATALAAVTAHTGQQAVVFVPATAPEAKRVQMQTYGARVIAVQGTYDQAFELCLQACRRWGWYNRNTALNPFTIEGKKSAALEIAVQMHPELPDVVLVPTGDGVILAGVAKGFDDLLRAGWIHRRPRLIAVQPEGSSAIVRALEDGARSPAAHPNAAGVADSLVVEMPRNGKLCLRRIRESRGAGVRVSDDEIVASIQRLARSTGVFAEPAAAAVVAGLEQALRRDLVARDERVVLLITGTGLKDVPAAAAGLTPQPALLPTLEAVAERVASWRSKP